MDGKIETINNPVLEPQCLFRGRGKHPKSGLLKPKTIPESVIINTSKWAPVPICPLPGRSWNQVVFNKNAFWLCKYKENLSNSFKYVQLSSNSSQKGIQDYLKFERARKLHKIIEIVRRDYQQKINSGGEEEVQIGVASYMIDFLAIRVGNDKSGDTADTVGCLSLRVEHVSFHEDYTIELDFVGKDSIRYRNKTQFNSEAYDRLKQMCQNKRAGDKIFDLISPGRINQYFGEFMNKLTAKVFRTYNASRTLEDQLMKTKILPTDT